MKVETKEPRLTPVKLEEMITLSILKGTRNTGSVKKMLHAPSLKLYAIKEIPLINREIHKVLKDWISTWQAAQDQTNDLLCNVYGTFWNVPEGCASVVVEHSNGGSLENLLESAGALPERTLQELTAKLLQCIKEVHSKIRVEHGCIIPSQVLFDQEGNVKLSLGIAHRLNLYKKDFSSDANAYRYASILSISLYNISSSNSPIQLREYFGVNKHGVGSSFKQDVFDLGLLLFIAALGGSEILDSKELERIAHRPTGACCVLHCDSKGSSQSSHLSISQYFTTKRFSPEFLDFLCKCLRFSESERLSIEELQAHSWLTLKTSKGAMVSLKELIQIGRQWRQSTASSEQQGTAEGQLERLCESMGSVLPCCENYEMIMAKFVKGQIEKEAIREIALDTGLDIEIVWDKLMKTIKKIQGSIYIKDKV